MNTPLFTGCATALVTPFLPDGRLDEPALRRLLFMQLEANIPGRVMFEIAGVPEDVAREALRLASHKLPIKTKVVKREDTETQEVGE